MLRSVDSDNNQTEETNMSIENAILELAAAIRYAADKTAGGTGNIAKLIENVTSCGYAMRTVSDSERTGEESRADMERTFKDIEADVTKVETDAKAQQEKVMKMVEADRKSAAKQAVADALAKAEAEKAKPVVEEDDPLGAVELDWDKDVRPALLAVGKDRDALVKLMAKYEVPKGGKAPVEKWADLLAEANAIAAARG